MSHAPPHRVVWRRSARWHPPNWSYYTVFVGTGSRWENPHRDGSKAENTMRYEEDLLSGRLPYTVEDVRTVLGSAHLGCWCGRSDRCHADVLLQVASLQTTS